MDVVTKWLSDINMEEHADKFEQHGLDRISIIANDMSPIDLYEMGISKPHSNYIMRKAKSIHSTNYSNDRSYNKRENVHSGLNDEIFMEDLEENDNNDGNVIWQQNSATLNEEFDSELMTTFDEIIAMFGNAQKGVLKSSLNEDVLSNAKQLTSVMNHINKEINQYQFHKKKCQKLYSLILHKKVQLQSMYNSFPLFIYFD